MWFNKRRLFSKSPALGLEVAPEEVLMDSLNPEDFNADQLEGRIESALGRFPFMIVAVLVAAAFLALISRTWFLQVTKGEEFAKRATENRLFTITLPAPRGIIYDIRKEPIVKNIPGFEVILKRGELPETAEGRRALMASLAKLLGNSEGDIKEAGFDPELLDDKLSSEIIVAADIPRELALELQSRPKEFPGVFVRTREFRDYAGAAFAHVIGYVGKIDKSQINQDERYRGDDIIGKNGVELTYEKELRGTPGEQLIEVNSSGARLGELPERRPVIGESLVLNIDAGLQRVLYDSLRRALETQGKTAGSAVAIDPRNGAVRALVSLPSFDPNVFQRHLSPLAYERTFLSSQKPLFNRAIGGVYPSGSVIKPMIAVAALEEQVIDPTKKIYDPGFISVPNPYRPGEETRFIDWRPQGWIDMRAALARSANVYFYIVGGGYQDVKGLGITKLGEYMRKFGFGAPLGIDISGEVGGLVPGPDTIAKTRPNDPVWRIGDTYQTSIGQGAFQATPLQIAAMIAAVANGGTLWRPRIASAILDEYGNVVKTIEPEAVRTNIAEPRSIQVAREGMRLVATEGTARAYFADFVIEVAAKTGTAQTGFQKNTHGWFTAFAPYQNPELVLVVVAEDVPFNTPIATPVAREVLYWYFTEGKKRILVAAPSQTSLP
ncbi:MAG: penicillin-binding protein 2 [Candidatus Sungbacteria bacterium]|uniref:Penicillin-binding protein 2 n=1 Tax=Candidatus Sungiibacteriota bacterium TaxID=2750080 RepID=A0A931SDT2_9BACT|nr:penicillin-binding protein 2 [Candidatus Sungbacteria bacterium]